MPLITLQQANDHLRLDIDLGVSPSDDQIPDLELKITQAEAIILDYLKVDDSQLITGSPSDWSARDVTVVQSAALLVLSALYDDDANRTLGDYMAPKGVIPLLLMRLRDPTVA